MATYDSSDHSSAFVDTMKHYEWKKASWWVPRGANSIAIGGVSRMCLNRGRNTGAGAAYVYWKSPTVPDPSGLYYKGSVPWGQITDVMWVGTT